MDSGVGKLLANLGDQNMHLFGLPTPDRGVEAHAKGLQSVFELDQIPRTEGFLDSVLAIGDFLSTSPPRAKNINNSPGACLSAKGQSGNVSSRSLRFEIQRFASSLPACGLGTNRDPNLWRF